MRVGTTLGQDDNSVQAVNDIKTYHSLNAGRLILIIVVVVIVVLIAFLVLHHTKQQVVTSANETNIRQMTASNKCSSKDVSSVSNLSSSVEAPSASIALYNYRVTCYTLENNLQAAIKELNEEKQFALSIHDSTDASNATTSIKNLQIQSQLNAKGAGK